MSLCRERVAAIIAYCPETGVFTWRKGWRAGKVAGCSSNGYLRVGIGGRNEQAHRIAWLLTYGRWPEGQIDHINGDRLDNRICNLRDVPPRGNQQNVTKRRDNKSGFLGVSFHVASGKWVAQINHMGRKRYLGVYDSADDAAQSYELAKHALHEYQPTERRICNA